MRNDESLPPLDADDPTTDAEKNIILRNAIDEAARNDPTRFTTRSFAVLENKDHSLRLINRDDARKAISIPWDELSALRTIIDIATQNTTTATAAAPPTTPSDAAMRAAEEIHDWIFSPPDSWPMKGDATKTQLAAIITRHLAKPSEPHCWHCGVVLAYAPKLRCEDCPTECDIEGCDEMGCATTAATTSPETDSETEGNL